MVEHNQSANVPSGMGYDNKYKFNGKELDDATGMYYYGARYYDPRISIFISVDPLAEQTMEPYLYTGNNPIMFTDPTGMSKESTHIDDKGNVVAVFDDGDKGVYQHGKNAEGGSVTEYQLSKRAEKHGTSSGGTKVGETEHWDEFVSPEDGTTMTQYKIQVGKSFDPIIEKLAKQADGMGLVQIASESRPKGDFDIKNDYKNVGALLNGKYATSRSAGNYLAGYNANNGVINYETFQKLAGALHVKGNLSKVEMGKMLLKGTSYGPAPAYGENMYQYRMSRQGWDDKQKELKVYRNPVPMGSKF
ncbi:MAG: RHS repeat-associated core domain-containing protein [Myroides sp.]|nr:RHS repeat-associated core domain-containing protein [Myroides sp.]